MIRWINVFVCFMWMMWFLGVMNIIQGNAQGDMTFFVLYGLTLVYLMLFVVKPLKAFQIRYQKYGKTLPFESKNKMKYITKFSSDKVIKTLDQYQEAYGMFDYKFETDNNGVYIFTINEIRQEYVYCGGKVKYKVFFTPEPGGMCSVALFI